MGLRLSLNDVMCARIFMRAASIGIAVAAGAGTGVLASSPSSNMGGQIVIDDFSTKSVGAPTRDEGDTESTAPPMREIVLGAGATARVASIMQQQFGMGSSNRSARRRLFSVSELRASYPQLALSRAVYDPVIRTVGETVSGNGTACEYYPYRVSNLLKPANEYRRQLLLPLVVREACAAGVPPGLLDALIIQESKYNVAALSPKGAVGLTQLMPGTASRLGRNAYSIEDNIRGGASYLRKMQNTFGQFHLALAAYNAGPGAVIRYNGVPNYRETKSYVGNIINMWRYLVQ